MNNSPQIVQQRPPSLPNQPQSQVMSAQHSNFVNQSQQQSVPIQNMQPNQPQGHIANTNLAIQQEIIAKTKKLIQDLKESLANLMNLLSKNISYNYQIDSGQKINAENCPRFDKAWGEFNATCNQLEVHFKTLQACASLKKENKIYIPYDLSPVYQVESQSNNSITYGQYVNLVKNQVKYSKVIQEMLMEGAKRISEMDTQQNNQFQQTIHNQPHGYHQGYAPQQSSQQKPMIMNQMNQQHSYHPNQMQMPNQSPMHIAQQSPIQIVNHSSPMMQRAGSQHQPSPMNQMNTNAPMQPVAQTLVHAQQPISGQMSSMQSQQGGYQSQMPSQMANQMNNQINHQQMKPQFMSHNNQMQ